MRDAHEVPITHDRDSRVRRVGDWPREATPLVLAAWSNRVCGARKALRTPGPRRRGSWRPQQCAHDSRMSCVATS